MAHRLTKDQLRSEYLRRRMLLTEAEYSQASADMAHIAVDWFKREHSEVKAVHLYYPLFKKKEPDTLLLRKRLTAELPAITVLLPKTHANGSMTHHVWMPNEKPVPGKWGLCEPDVHWTQMPESVIEAVFVPLLAVSPEGHRIGYGKGYYDRMFARCTNSCLRIGYGFFAPCINAWEHEAHDIPLTHYITPHHIYSFSHD